MRRLVLSVIVASGLVMAGASSASAGPARVAAEAKAAAGKKVCKVQNSRLTELSGLVATADGFIAINDGSLAESSKRVYYLDDDCTIVNQVSYSGGGPRDTEDMVLSADGKTLWIADIGDNDGVRQTVGLWKMPASGSKRPVLNRLTYPDGAHDAEAMLLNGDGTPIIVTKGIGKAGLYVPTGPLKANTTDGVPMRRVGEVDLPASTTSNPLSTPGRLVVTGGAVAPDGSRVVLRTYADAFEFDVTDGDVLAALKGKPRATPLPDEPQGEAITYSADGKTFLTTSDMQGRTDGDPNYILRYTPAAQAAVSVKSTTAAAKPAGGNPSWSASLSLQDITYLVGGVGLLGAVLVGLGIFGIMRSRRRPPSPAARNGGPTGPPPSDPDAATALMEPVREGSGQAGGGRSGPSGRPVGGGPGGGGPGGGALRGGGRSGAGPGGGSPPAVPQKGSGIYGGAPSTGRPGVYGVPPAGPPPGRPAGPPPGRPAGPPPGRLAGPPPAGPAGPPPGRPAGFFGTGPVEGDRTPQGPSRPVSPQQERLQPGAGHPGARHQGAGMNTYADVNGTGRGDERFGNPGGYGRPPRGR